MVPVVVRRSDPGSRVPTAPTRETTGFTATAATCFAVVVLAAGFSAGDHVLAALAGVAAGAVNAIAGGGTLISFPTLVALGAPNVRANVTNTVALCPGYFGGAVAQRSIVATERARLRPLCLAGGLGGLAGSILLVASGEAVFERLVPWLILLSCALLAAQQPLRTLLQRSSRQLHEGPPGRAASPAAILSIFAASIYGGYFGAGFGIMTLAVLGLLYDDELPRLNAIKQVLSLAVNVIAAAFFIGDGKVLWSLALVMGPASLLGGMAGGRLVGIIRPTVLRVVVVAYGSVLAVYYLLR